MNFLFEEPFKIFTYANFALSLFFIIEVLLIITGASFSKAFDKNFDIDKNVNMWGDDISFSKELDVSMNYDINFFQVGKVPFLVIILSLLVGFSTLGYGVHFLTKNIFDIFLSNYVVVPIATAGSVISTILIAKLLTNVFKVEETYAVNKDVLIGRKGVVLPGMMTNENQVQVKIKNEHGEYHYVLCNTLIDGEVCETNEEVIVLRKNNQDGFYVTKSIEKMKEINS